MGMPPPLTPRPTGPQRIWYTDCRYFADGEALMYRGMLKGRRVTLPVRVASAYTNQYGRVSYRLVQPDGKPFTNYGHLEDLIGPHTWSNMGDRHHLIEDDESPPALPGGPLRQYRVRVHRVVVQEAFVDVRADSPAAASAAAEAAGVPPAAAEYYATRPIAIGLEDRGPA